MKKLLAIGFLVFSLIECYQSDYTRAGRMPLWKRGSVTTLSVVSNAAMGAVQLQKILSYLIEDEKKSYIAAASIAGIVALVNEYIQLKQLNKDCKHAGAYAYKKHYSCANEEQYDYGTERMYYKGKFEAVGLSLIWGSVIGAATGGIVYMFKKDAIQALVSASRTTSNLYWIARLISAMTVRINF